MANYILLERIELAASAASVTFSNIPQTGYTDLKVVMSVRNTGDFNTVGLVLNGVSTNQTARRVIGSGSSASSSTYTEVQDNPSSSTANTFSNGELYIPNYTSSTNKSMSFDIVSENNATLAYATLEAWLWSQTAAITSVGFTGLYGGSIAANSTFSLYGLAAVGTTPVIAPKASGGNITTDGTYWIHTFNASGTFTPQLGLSCDYLVVAGGGGGGGGSSGSSRSGGGGGAGGYLTSIGGSPLSVTATAYSITVGAGGAGAALNGGRGSSGSNSVFSSVTATGGGAGGGGATGSLTGGSGGGGGGFTGLLSGASGTAGQGNSGGSGENGLGRGGGGGGATGGGSTPGPNPGDAGGNGGAGTSSSITGSAVTRSGGGGGGTDSDWTPTGSGGSGGGGAGGIAGVGANGTVNTGGGAGGGGGRFGSGGGGGTGGSGVVIIRYPIA